MGEIYLLKCIMQNKIVTTHLRVNNAISSVKGVE